MRQIYAFICKLSRSSQPILNAEFKLGGSPVFYQPVSWPVCSNCGKEMDFLAQVPLQNPISFSSSYAMAYIFMCPGKFDERGWLDCETWEPFSGANKVIIQEYSDDMIAVSRTSEYPDYSIELIRASEPNIDTTDYSFSEELLTSVYEATKLGGVPTWLQDNETPICPNCHKPMTFVAQFVAELDGMLPGDPRKRKEKDYKFFHFGGDDGIGYLFICQDECSDKCSVFLWQCT
jgi:hypothetical protein